MAEFDVDAPPSSGSDHPARGPDYKRLLALLENATEGSDGMDALIVLELYGGPSEELAGLIGLGIARTLNFTTSLDAALTLVPEGYGWSAQRNRAGRIGAHVWGNDGEISSGFIHAPTAPLALCMAALKARSAP